MSSTDNNYSPCPWTLLGMLGWTSPFDASGAPVVNIKAWLSNHSISSKTVASAWVFVTALWYVSPPFHDYIFDAYSALPKGIHGFIAGVLIPALIFWRTQRKTTVTAEISPGETGAAGAVAASKEPTP